MASVLFHGVRSIARISTHRTNLNRQLRVLSCGISRFPSQNFLSARPASSSTASISGDNVMRSDLQDSLVKQLTIEIQGHDRAVIESYTKFMGMATDGFGLNHVQVIEKPKYIWRTTLLKSVHVHKKHRVQYETRNYYKIFVINYLTGSTASTFLEYVQRNLPEGVAMKVTTETAEKFPSHLNLESD